MEISYGKKPLITTRLITAQLLQKRKKVLRIDS